MYSSPNYVAPAISSAGCVCVTCLYVRISTFPSDFLDTFLQVPKDPVPMVSTTTNSLSFEESFGISAAVRERFRI